MSDTPEGIQLENTRLRRLLFLTHPCVGKYGDEGEMCCANCGIDFKREPVNDIDRKLLVAGQRRLQAQLRQGNHENMRARWLERIMVRLEKLIVDVTHGVPCELSMALAELQRWSQSEPEPTFAENLNGIDGVTTNIVRTLQEGDRIIP